LVHEEGRIVCRKWQITPGRNAPIETIALDREIRVEFEDVARDAIFARQFVSIDVSHCGQQVHMMCAPQGYGLRRSIGDLIVIAVITERGRVLRGLHQLPFPFRIQQLV
jgi:hypothetical protein